MANFTGYFKIVQPKAEGETIVDSNQDLVGAGSYSNNAWYHNVVKGVTSRMVQYQQYSSMDADVEVSRALNTIAEEMTGNDPKTNEPINIELLTTDKTRYDSTEVLTLKAALARWNSIHDWESKLFNVCRNTVKYGDVFFRKNKNGFDKKWEYIHPKNVVAAVVDPNDVTKIIAWQVRSQMKKPKYSHNSHIQKNVSGADDQTTQWIPANEIVQITLNDEMSTSAPFGVSILASVYKAFKQKELMEDATIIYRVQRAPERRVFYIDVGNMPVQRAKAQIEQYKNDIKQKKIPSFNGGQQTVDSVYNPQSMNEDFYMAVRPEGRGSRIETLPGGHGGGDTDELEYFQRRLWEGLNIPTSYMMTDDAGASFSDGKVGVAYIQELRFAQFIGRLQRHVENELDSEFKKWLKSAKIYIDPLLYRLRLPSPSNFGKYRQQEMDGNLLGQYGSADGTEYLSKRFIMSRYLQLSDEEIVMNERMKREEMGIPLDENTPEIFKRLYNGAVDDDLDGGFGGDSIDTTSDTDELSNDGGDSNEDAAPEGDG